MRPWSDCRVREGGKRRQQRREVKVDAVVEEAKVIEAAIEGGSLQLP
jgi:hypothetical protein